MEQLNMNINNGSGGGDSPNSCRGGRNLAEAPSSSSFGGQMINPMAFMAQYQGMMSNIPNNPQDMMSMMGAYCQTANGGGNVGMGGFSGFPNESNSQGMNINPMAQMMRKRTIDVSNNDDQPPAAKRCNFGSGNDLSTFERKDSNGSSAHVSVGPKNESPKLAPGSPGARNDHIVVPPSKEGIKFYSRNDVLCGRGGGTNVHPGNRRFRDLINANRRAYLKARKNDKPAISRSIVRSIRELNGRFLKKDEKLGLWFEIGDDGAREKTSQALRQRAPEMRKILFEDEQRQQQQEMMQRHQLMAMGPGMQMQGIGGAGPMGGNMGNITNMGNQMVNNNNGGGENDISLLAKYNMLHQKNWLAQEKNMILQRLAMSGINPNMLSNTQGNIENMTTQTLLQGGMKPVTPRGA